MRSREGRDWLAPKFVIPALALLLAGVGLLAPSSFLTDLAGAGCVTAILVASWTVFCGPTREISFGQAFFVGGAGYLSGLLQARLGWEPWLALGFGVGGGAVLGATVAILTFRHRGLYFSMVTMALQLALYRALFLGSSVFGGEEGVLGMRPLAESRMGIYAASAVCLVAAFWGAGAFLRSRAGLLLAATGQNEPLALSLGADVPRLRLLGLSLSGALAGLGGALYVLTQGQANAELASEELSVRILLLGMVGGLWSLPGALVSTFSLQATQAMLFRWTQHDALIYTGLLLGLVLLLPRGLVPHRPRWGRAPLPRAGEGRTATATAKEKTREGLELDGLEVRFGGVRALQGVALSVDRGRSIGLIGPNGAGKTTLLNVIAGARAASGGEIRWGGRSLGRLGTSARARLGIRKTHQQVIFFPDLTLREHLEVARRAVHPSPARGRGAGGEGPELARLLALCGGDDIPLGQLPPAAARLAEIAMALAAPPELLLLDEPFAALSGPEVEAVCSAVQELQRQGVTLVIVEHRLHELFRLVEEVVVLDRGQVIARKPPDEVLLDPAVLAAYGIGESREAAG